MRWRKKKIFTLISVPFILAKENGKKRFMFFIEALAKLLRI